MLVSFETKTVLITGGTRGVGLSTALIFAKLGARCIMTYRWGSEDEDAIRKQFLDLKAPEPILFQADVAKLEDTKNLMQFVKNECGLYKIDIFISNVSSAAVIKDFEDYSLKQLEKSIKYSSWPVFEYTKQIQKAFGSYPRHVVAVSSTGPDQYSFGYDYVAFTKSVMETLCKYMSYRLKDEDVHLNIVRSRAIKTESLENTFGKELEEFAKQLVPDSYWIKPEEVAGSVVMLCSGLLDAMNGQIINVDRGTSFFDNIMDIYTRRDSLPIFNQKEAN